MLRRTQHVSLSIPSESANSNMKADENHGRSTLQCVAHPASSIRAEVIHSPDMGTFEALAIFFLSGCQSQSVAQSKPKYSAKSHLTSCC